MVFAVVREDAGIYAASQRIPSGAVFIMAF